MGNQLNSFFESASKQIKSIPNPKELIQKPKSLTKSFRNQSNSLLNALEINQIPIKSSGNPVKIDLIFYETLQISSKGLPNQSNQIHTKSLGIHLKTKILNQIL